jgi:hypothetical protein
MILEMKGAKALARAIKVNLMLENIRLQGNSIGSDLTSHITETLKENLIRKEKNYRKFICAFTVFFR